MRILRNSKRERELFNKVQATLEKEREGIHASDLLAPRLSYFRKLFPLPLAPEEVGYFAAGHGHHMFLVHLDTGKKGESQEESCTSKKYGITYSPDLRKSKAEFKTARYMKLPVTEKQCIKDFDRYAKQCLIYALCEGVTKWHLYMLYIGLRKVDDAGKMVGGLQAPVLQCYTIMWTEEELAEGDEWLRNQVDLFEEALETKTHAMLPLCEEWQCIRFNTQTRRKEVTCPYFTKCKPKGRYELLKEGLHNPFAEEKK